MSSSLPGHSFLAGRLLGVPIYVNYWTFAFFVLNVMRSSSMWNAPVWWSLSFATLSQIVVYLTVLVHEFGHGLMTRHVGGSIEKILLWPLGGICYSLMPVCEDSREKVQKELLVVLAGPVTHWFQAPMWATILHLSSPEVDVWQFFNPLGHGWNLGVHSWVPRLWLAVLGQAIMTNVLLFLFNFFLPMYPLDASKIFTSILQLSFGFSVRKTAQSLILVSGVCSVAMIAYGLMYHGGQMLVLIGAMCAVETWQIKVLLDSDRLGAHPLFSHNDLPTQSQNYNELFSGHPHTLSEERPRV